MWDLTWQFELRWTFQNPGLKWKYHCARKLSATNVMWDEFALETAAWNMEITQTSLKWLPVPPHDCRNVTAAAQTPHPAISQDSSRKHQCKGWCDTRYWSSCTPLSSLRTFYKNRTKEKYFQPFSFKSRRGSSETAEQVPDERSVHFWEAKDHVFRFHWKTKPDF